MKHFLMSFLFSAVIGLTASAQLTAYDWYNKGLNLNDSLKHADALKAYDKAILLDSKFTDAYYRAGWTHNELGNFDKAIEKLTKAVELKKDYDFALQELGYAYKKKQNYVEALNYLNRAIVAKPDYANAYKQLGDVYFKLKRDPEGLLAYEKAYSLNNRDVSSCFELGFWYNGHKNFDKALEWLNKAIAIKPSFDTYNELGFAYYSLKKNDEAIASYKAALNLNPLNGTAYKGIGDVYRRNYSPAKTTEAIENYRKAIRNNPKSAGSYFGLGWCYNELANYDSSIVILKKSLDLDKSLTNAYSELGYAQYMKGYYNDALATFNVGLTLNDKSTLCIYYKGLVFIALKDKVSALQAYNQLKPLDAGLADKLLTKTNALQ